MSENKPTMRHFSQARFTTRLLDTREVLFQKGQQARVTQSTNEANHAGEKMSSAFTVNASAAAESL